MERDSYFVNSSGFAMEAQSGELNSEQNLQNCFFNPNSVISSDQNDPFESALSSIVSSPAASHCPAAGGGGEGVLLRELIGRLGSICNPGEISPESYLRSTNTSCYSTPMNSPPKLNLMEKKNPNFDFNFNFAGTLIPADPGFAERAARYSCFGGGKLGQNDAGSAYGSAPPPRAVSGKDSLRVAGAQPAAKPSSPENGELGGSREGSSVSEQVPAGHNRKRKSIPRGKAREGPSVSAKDTKIAAGNDNEESKPKKSKQEAATESDKNGGNQKQNKDSDSKPPEPPKDYIHVRARRGQATDSHSLAERVRREKISERMKFLQDLVPGCNKLTGKAVMLDEIINYVQSLQRQVEFLSMKLSTVNPRMDFNMETLLSKEALQSCGSLPQGVYPLDSSVPAFPYGFHPQQLVNAPNGTSMALPHGDGFGETSAPPQVPGFWEDDLQSLVQMGFCPNQPQPQNLHGSQMKLEL